MQRLKSAKGTSRAVCCVLAGLFAASAMLAQDQDPSPATRSIPTMVGQLLDHDFVNFYVFGNAIYDSRLPILSSSGQTLGNGSWGYQVGGGVTLAHQFRDGDISLSYRGDYRDYTSTRFGGGTDQNLSLLYNKRLSRHWTVSLPVSAGVLLYGAGGYIVSPSAGSAVAPNPLSPQTRYVQTGVNFTYQQTRRLSYVFSGNFFLNDYNYVGAIGSKGVSGAASALYRITGKTTVGATYSHSYYHYAQGAGTTSVDGESLSLTHDFPDHWQASLSAGINRTYTQGVVSTPVSVLLGQQTVQGFFVGPYERTTYVPSFQGSLTRFFRHSSASLTGGQGVIPGNGTFLTSRDQFLTGLYSLSMRRSNIGLATSYFHLTSIANVVTSSYTTESFNASYGYVLRRHLSANVSYSFLHYGNLFSLGSINDNVITLGLSLSTQSLPLGLF
ncbi:MAG TPA: hypothetical protein VK604_09720 [Bryobacteraceae bacterium]|nr:hypothetical protein [Bryobacteraceae bacterium]